MPRSDATRKNTTRQKQTNETELGASAFGAKQDPFVELALGELSHARSSVLGGAGSHANWADEALALDLPPPPPLPAGASALDVSADAVAAAEARALPTLTVRVWNDNLGGDALIGEVRIEGRDDVPR